MLLSVPGLRDRGYVFLDYRCHYSINLITLKFPTWEFPLKARGCPQQGTSRLLHAFAGNDDDEEEDDDDLLDIQSVPLSCSVPK